MKELILNFHGLGHPPVETDRSEIPYWWDKAAFETVLNTLEAQAPAHRAQFKITFDDGNASDALIALPALDARSLKATFFICAGRIGTPGYLDASAIKDLLQSGMKIGSHGMNHVDWRATSNEQLHVEISDAKRMLEQVSGQPICEAGIPFGSYDRRVLAKLRSEGFLTVYTSDGGIARNHLWIKPRNTLDRSFYGHDLMKRLNQRNTVAARLHRFLMTRYKSLR